MLFGRSASGRTRMISFLIICNLVLAISFFTTAKVTVTLSAAERKHRDEIRILKDKLSTCTIAAAETKKLDGTVIDIINTYTEANKTLSRENMYLRLENDNLIKENKGLRLINKK